MFHISSHGHQPQLGIDRAEQRVRAQVRRAHGMVLDRAFVLSPTAEWAPYSSACARRSGLCRTVEALNAAGHRSGQGKPLTARIVLEARRSNNLPSHADRLRAQGLLTNTELAAQLGVQPSTVKSWTRTGILNSHKADNSSRYLEVHRSGGTSRNN
jgi:DNA-binding transcriptional regulator YiaG